MVAKSRARASAGAWHEFARRQDQRSSEPTFIRPNFERMPAELKQRKNWVLWVPIRKESKWTKRPIQPSGFGASTTNPKHWSSFEDVKHAYESAVQRGYVEVYEKDKPAQRFPIGGVGFVFDGQPDEDGLVFAGVDFDRGAFKDEISSFSAERVKRLESYVEASVSGTGIHVIVKAHLLASGIHHDGIELYTSGRFFTMTGRTGAVARPVIAAPAAFAALAEELQNQAGHRAVREADTPPARYGLSDFTSADRERLQKLFGHLPVETLRKASKRTSKKSDPPYRQFPPRQFAPSLSG
jgi:primase-polymerase (primpol)-like protein